MQKVPAGAQLGRTKTGQAIGYRVLNLDRSPFRIFTRDGVSETAIPGHYTALGGVSAPDLGGYVIWGTEAQDMAEATIEPAVDITERLLSGIAAGLDALLTSIIRAMPTTPVFPPVIVNTVEFETGVATLRAELVELAASSNQAHASRVSELQAQLDAVIDVNNRLQILNDTVREMHALTDVHDRLTAIFGMAAPVAPVIVKEADPRIASVIETVRADIDRLSQDMAATKTANARKDRTIAELDKFLQKVGGA
jgi:hypothetical protein